MPNDGATRHSGRFDVITMRPMSLFESGHSHGDVSLTALLEGEAWRPQMRSHARLRIAPVRYFVDPSLGPAVLTIGSTELIADPNALGFHFNALVVRDLRIYAQPLHGVLDSWRDSNGNEVDAIVSIRDNKWGAFEVKLNPDSVDEAAASLLRFAANVDTSKHGEPAALVVITSTGYAGRRSDGVHVIPITTLRPKTATRPVTSLASGARICVYGDVCRVRRSEHGWAHLQPALPVGGDGVIV